MQVELLEAKTERPALWGGGGRGDECRHLSRHGFGLRPPAGLCGLGFFPRYAMKSRQQATAERPPAKRRGPKPSISDEALLVAIEADLEASPWEGQGHRKVWARLRVCRGIRVSRANDARENLLSPHRCRRRGGNPHVGEIITHAPNLMWGTGMDDGWGWVFTAIEHWNAECVGWHVCKRGDRFAALQPISMGLARLILDLRRCGAGAGLADGSRLPAVGQKEIKFWGIQPSYAFVEQPQTNGVAEGSIGSRNRSSTSRSWERRPRVSNNARRTAT